MTGPGVVRRLWARLGPSGPVFAARTFAILASLVAVVVMSRALGPAGRGQVALFAVLQLFLSTSGGFGTSSAAYVLAARDNANVPAILGGTIAWCAIVAVVAAIGWTALALVGLVDGWFTDDVRILAVLLITGSVGQYLASTATQIAIGTGRPRLTAVGFAAAPAAIMVGALVAWIGGGSATAFMGVQAAGWCAAGLATSSLLRTAPQWRPRILPILAGSGSRAALGDIANALSYRLDTLILGLIAGTAAVGIYTLAVQLLEPIWVVATAAASGLLIRYRTLPVGEWARAARRLAIVVVTLTAAGALMVVAMVPLVVELVGRAFEPTWAAAACLAPGVVMLAGSKVMAAHQLGSGRLWLGSLVATLSLALTTAMDLMLIPSLGATGAAAASTLGYSASAIMWAIAFRQLPSIDLAALGRPRGLS